MAFVDKYILEFEEKIFPPSGATYTQDIWRVKIQEDGFGGSVTYLNGTENPLQINYTNFELYKTNIVASEAIINVVTTSFNQLSEVTLADEFTYKVVILRNSSTFWVGWVTPGDYEENYTESNLIDIKIRASDGLERLGTYDIDMTNENTATSIFTIIDDCLSNTQLGLEYYENVDMYDVIMDSTAADSPIEQAKIYPATLFTDSDQSTVDCKETLEAILRAFNSYIIQKDGAWYINFIPVNDGAANYTLRYFNSTPTYQSNSSVDPVLTLTNNGNSQVRLQSMIQFKRPIKRIRTQVDLDKPLNLVVDGDFYLNAWYNDNPSGPDLFKLSQWTEVNASASILQFSGSSLATYTACELATGSTGGYIASRWIRVNADIGTLDFTFKYRVNYTGTGTAATVRYMIEYAEIINDSSSGYQYVNSSGNWTTSPTSLTKTADVEEDDVFIEIQKLAIDAPPGDGFIRVRLYEVEPGTRTVSDYYVTHCRMTTNGSLADIGNEVYKLQTEDSGDNSEVLEIKNILGDKGTYGSHSFPSGAFAFLQFEIDFGSVVNGETVSFDILGTTRTFTYQSSPGIGTDEFSSSTQLVGLIQAYTGDHYSVWETNQGVNLEDIHIQANFNEVETNEDYGWGTPTYDTNITQVSKTNPSDATSISSASRTNRGVLVMTNNGHNERISHWDDGSLGGNLLYLQFNYIHACYGSVHQKHRGKLMDWSKSHSPVSVIHDPLYNNGKYFLFTGGTFNPIYGEWEGQWQQVATTKKTLTKNYITV